METAPYKSTFSVGSGFHPRPDICTTKGRRGMVTAPYQPMFSVGSGFHPRPDICTTKGRRGMETAPYKPMFSVGSGFHPRPDIWRYVIRSGVPSPTDYVQPPRRCMKIYGHLTERILGKNLVLHIIMQHGANYVIICNNQLLHNFAQQVFLLHIIRDILIKYSAFL